MNCKVMGIVNVTPDSFSDGGQFFRPEEAIRRAKNLIADGADIIDLGGESTRPGATPIGWEEEWSRIEPVLVGLMSPEAIAKPCCGCISVKCTSEEMDESALFCAFHGNAPTRKRGFAIASPVSRLKSFQISVDTYHPETAARAIAAGANIINCVYSEPIPEMVKLLAGNAVELVVPWKCFETLASASRRDADGTVDRLYLDPMIGFGTTREEDLELLRSIPELAKKGRVLVGASRKRIVKKLVGEKSSVGKNIGGNVAIAVWAAMNGASVVRVHDVKETVQALRVVERLRG